MKNNVKSKTLLAFLPQKMNRLIFNDIKWKSSNLDFNKSNIKKLFSLGNLCFFVIPSMDQEIKRAYRFSCCKNCELVQLGHMDIKYLYGPDYGYRTGINKTMLTHVKNVTKYLASTN